MKKGPKPLFWIASSRKNLKQFPPETRKKVGFALWQAQKGGKPLNAKSLHGFGGAGVLELVEDHDGNTFRAIYTIKFARAVYVLHAFQKKSKKAAKTPKQEMDLIKKRLKAAEEHYGEWHAVQQENEEDVEGEEPS